MPPRAGCLTFLYQLHCCPPPLHPISHSSSSTLRATPALVVSNGSAGTLSRGALIDYRLRQHELTERQ